MKKTSDTKIEMSDYCKQSVFEGLVNALIHRDYLINGCEVYKDVFDDLLAIYFPANVLTLLIQVDG